MQTIKKIGFVTVFFVLSTNISASQVDCSIYVIEKLSPAEQLSRYTTCSQLMGSRLKMLKLKGELKKQSVDLSNRLPSPPPLERAKESYIGAPIGVSYIEGVHGNMTAELIWEDGRVMRVKKGSPIQAYSKVLEITANGVKLSSPKRSGQPIFLGVGQSDLNRTTNNNRRF